MDKGGEDEIVVDQLTSTMVSEHFEMVVSDANLQHGNLAQYKVCGGSSILLRELILLNHPETCRLRNGVAIDSSRQQ